MIGYFYFIKDKYKKDLENIKGDLANDYKTIPILYGEKTSKIIIAFLTLLTVVPVFIFVLIAVFE